MNIYSNGWKYKENVIMWIGIVWWCRGLWVCRSLVVQVYNDISLTNGADGGANAGGGVPGALSFHSVFFLASTNQILSLSLCSTNRTEQFEKTEKCSSPQIQG